MFKCMACISTRWTDHCVIFIYFSVSVCKFLIATHECSAVTSVCEELSWSHFSVCIPMPDFQHLSLISPSCYTDQKTQHFLSQFWDKHIHISLENIFLLSHQKYHTLWSEITIIENKHMAALLPLPLLKKRSYLDSSAPVIIVIISQVLGVVFISENSFFENNKQLI